MFSISWDLIHPTRPFYWLETVQNLIGILSLWITATPVWIFASCCQLLVIYFKGLATELESLIENNIEKTNGGQNLGYRTIEALQPLKQLYLATKVLHQRFSAMLMANCYITSLFILTSTYYVIDYIRASKVLVTCWDASFVVDSFIRFWVICHGADRVRDAVSYYV